MHIAFRFLSLIITILFAVLTFGCGGPDKPPTGEVIIGLTTNLRVGIDLMELRIVQKVNGETRATQTLFADGASPFTLPLELPFSGLPEGDEVEVDVEAYGGSSLLLLTRRAATTVLADKKLLLRVDLSSTCIGSKAPICDEALTCASGACRTPYVHPALLEEYWAGWKKGQTDICKPNDGPPVLLVGKGMSDYLPVTDYEVAQLEAGPQGGHHIWIALRMKNLRQSGSITTLSGYIKELDTETTPFSVIFTFDPDEGGYCKLYGLRFQLDGNVKVDQLLGKTVRVTATVKDKDGDVGTGEKWVKLSNDVL
jgi:hypothetical protein